MRRTPSARSGGLTGRARSSWWRQEPMRSSPQWVVATPTPRPPPPASASCSPLVPRGMSDASLRIVLRHELFHYAARADTAADAPRWLTEGVADFIGRPQTPLPANAAVMTAARTPHRRRVERTRTLAGLRPSLVVQPVRGRASTAPRPCGRCTSGRADTATPTWPPRCRTPSEPTSPDCWPQWRQWRTG